MIRDLNLKSKAIIKVLFEVQIVLLYLPILCLFSLSTDNGPIPASICYFFSVVFLPFLLKSFSTLRLPPWYLTALWVLVMAIATIRIPEYGLSKSVLHWVFGFYLLVVIINVGSILTADDWLNALELSAVVFAVLHLAFMIFNYKIVFQIITEYFYGTSNGSLSAIIPSLTRGGRNLDASWLGLGAFFVRGKKKAFYVSYTLLFAFMGASRVGIAAMCLVILWSLMYDSIYRLSLKKIKWYALYSVIMIILLFGSGMAQATLSRMLINVEAPAMFLKLEEAPIQDNSELLIHIYGEPKAAVLSGRADIWKRIPQMVKDNPFGYGVGNAMRVMKAQYGFKNYEDVVHSVPLQWLVDEGIIGGLWYLGLVVALFVGQWKQRPYLFKSPFAAYFFTYFVLSLVQFHGGEALMIFVLGVYLTSKDTKFIQISKLWDRNKTVVNETNSKKITSAS